MPCRLEQRLFEHDGFLRSRNGHGEEADCAGNIFSGKGTVVWRAVSVPARTREWLRVRMQDSCRKRDSSTRLGFATLAQNDITNQKSKTAASEGGRSAQEIGSAISAWLWFRPAWEQQYRRVWVRSSPDAELRQLLLPALAVPARRTERCRRPRSL